MIAPAMLSSPERNGATVHLKDRQVNSPPGSTGWAEPWNWPGDWQASSESSRARKTSNLISVFYTNLRALTAETDALGGRKHPPAGTIPRGVAKGGKGASPDNPARKAGCAPEHNYTANRLSLLVLAEGLQLTGRTSWSFASATWTEWGTPVVDRN